MGIRQRIEWLKWPPERVPARTIAGGGPAVVAGRTRRAVEYLIAGRGRPVTARLRTSGTAGSDASGGGSWTGGYVTASGLGASRPVGSEGRDGRASVDAGLHFYERVFRGKPNSAAVEFFAAFGGGSRPTPTEPCGMPPDAGWPVDRARAVECAQGRASHELVGRRRERAAHNGPRGVLRRTGVRPIPSGTHHGPRPSRHG